MATKLCVAVLMGGPSSEHEISLRSGQGVAKALEGERYAPLPITIRKDGQWVFPGKAPLSIYDALPRLRDLEVDCVFIALHGHFGEDGKIQGLLDILGLPYTGSGCAASALAMDKVRSKSVVQAQGIRVAAHIAFDKAAWDGDPENTAAAVARDIGFPCVVKASCQGSSFGIEMPQDAAALPAAIDAVFQTDDYLLVEEFVTGTEVTCSVLDAEPNGKIRALPVTEIRPKTSAYFDYEAKYTPGASDEITPAEISPEMTTVVQEMAEHAHDVVGCRGWSRSDFIIDGLGPVWIEVNTVPGLTETSLYPQACAAAGISYAGMVSLFVEAAIREAKQLATIHSPLAGMDTRHKP